MNNLILIDACSDESCCCFRQKSTVILISVLNTIVCIADLVTVERDYNVDSLKSYVDSMRFVLMMLFQGANMLLFAAAVFENPALMSIYISHTLGFIVMGLGVSLVDMLLRFKNEKDHGVINFLSETAFLFVISRCLPLVNSYRNALVQDFE